MSVFAIPVRRPVATAMFFLALFLLGAIAWREIPVELFPPTGGDQLNVSFARPGSEPEVIEREILLPLEARVGEFRDIKETRASIQGSLGNFTIFFQPGADLETAELELSRLASQIQHGQPPGTLLDVRPDPFQQLTEAGFALYLQVTGMDDRNSLLDLVQQEIVPRLAAVPGLSQVVAFGGAPRELTVSVDPDRCAAVGITPDEVTSALQRAVKRLDYLGGTEDEAGRTLVVLDGRPRGVVTLAATRIRPGLPVELRHVADVELGSGLEENLYRVNGQPAVGLIMFQEEGSNLVRLARRLRGKLDELRQEYRHHGIDFVINFDGGELIEDQLDRLKKLALSGFVIALGALFLFLRQWRAVCVVAVAVPASLLCALAMLFLAGQSLNVITLFGLAIGIGMLVDNSIVVYEAVQRQLEHGSDPDHAAEHGVRRTVRAILAATATNVIVFLPVAYADIGSASLRSLLIVLALAILLPLSASVLVALGLVPLLARRLAAPAAMARIAKLRRRRRRTGGLARPDRARELFGALLKVSLRRPGGWVTGCLAALLFTIIFAIPVVGIGSLNQEPPETTQVRTPLEIAAGGSMDKATSSFERVEQAVMEIEGVEQVESFLQEQGGSLTVHIPPKDERPKELTAARIRKVIRDTVKQLQGVQLPAAASADGGGSGGVADILGQGPATVIISGPDARQLKLLADQIETNVKSIPEIGEASVSSRSSRDEIRVTPQPLQLQGYGLTADQVLPVLNLMRREGVVMRTGFALPDGEEIPLTVRRVGGTKVTSEELRRLRLATPAGVLPLNAVADVHKFPPPPTINHHDGRREIEVRYTFSSDAPESGPARQALEEQVRTAIQQVHRPVGYTIETKGSEESFDWFKRILVPVLLLLYAVMAVTFESLTMPLLVLVSLPLTVLGATWALVFAGMPLEPMALAGVLALIGLTVNPAILLVDRMQQRAWLGGRSAGAAALAAVRERARPVLMTASTTVLGLWPLALVTGRENEIWPPFATVVMGGLITSTLLTLLVIPVGFVFLHRLDRLFGRLGPWVGLAWAGSTTAIMMSLILTDVITSVLWQVVTTLLVAAVLLGAAVLIFRRPEKAEPHMDGGPPEVDVRCLRKTYGLPGPIGRAWRSTQRFVERVLERGGKAFDPREAAARIPPLLIVLAGVLYLVVFLNSIFWRTIFLYVGAGIAAAVWRQIRRARGKADELGRVEPGGLENLAAGLMPWAATAYFVLKFYLLDWLQDGRSDVRLWVPITLIVVVAFIQFARSTAVRLSRGLIRERVDEGRLRGARNAWRRFSRTCFGFDLPHELVHAIRGVHFNVKQGMVGILGPNGAGKTTLLRQLAGVLDPSSGVIAVGGVHLPRLRRYLARWVGYLPQDFGLPDEMTAREYLTYYALLYELRPAERRRERVDKLLEEVGLGERADEKIGGYSGGMRQRVAVARTLLRLPAVIIVDEPTVGLDPRERIRFRNLLSRLAEGRIVLFSTHVVEDVEVACERVIVFARGRIVFDGLPEDLADEAKGRVWTTRLTPAQEAALPEGALIVDQVPEADGTMRTRILSDNAPIEAADSTAPSLQDGYLWLVGDQVPV